MVLCGRGLSFLYRNFLSKKVQNEIKYLEVVMDFTKNIYIFI